MIRYKGNVVYHNLPNFVVGKDFARNFYIALFVVPSGEMDIGFWISATARYPPRQRYCAVVICNWFLYVWKVVLKVFRALYLISRIPCSEIFTRHVLVPLRSNNKSNEFANSQQFITYSLFYSPP